MDGRGRWMDNVFIERLWRSLKYECVYLHAFETGSELRAGLDALDRLLQWPPAALSAGRADPGRGICGDRARSEGNGEIGGLT